MILGTTWEEILSDPWSALGFAAIAVLVIGMMWQAVK